MGSKSHKPGAEVLMHCFTVDCDTFSNEEIVSLVVSVTSVEVELTGSKAMFYEVNYI